MLVIERLLLAEAKRFRTLRLAALKEAPEAFCSTYRQIARLPNKAWTEQIKDLPTFVAMTAGIDIGMVRIKISPPEMAHLHSLWVAPQYRGQGVGDALIDTIKNWVKSQGVKCLILYVIDNNEPALALYHRQGFKPSGESEVLPYPRDNMSQIRMVVSL